MGKNFNITEILESVDSIISNVNDQSYKNYNKKEIINNYKLFTKKYKSKINNPETEKIINDAEKSLEENNFLGKKARDALVLKKTGESLGKKLSSILILNNEHIEEENIKKKL